VSLDELEIRTGDLADPTLGRGEVLSRHLTEGVHVLVLTGAGVSVASGIPAYRTPEHLSGGARSPYDPDHVPVHLDATGGQVDVDALWAHWGPRRAAVTAARPNLAHLVLARYLAEGPSLRRTRTLVTQNVDDLHERAAEAHVGAGSGPYPVAHLHGRLLVSRCSRDRRCYSVDDTAAHTGAPPCPRCGAKLRPDVVLFGEQVDVDAQWTARQAVRECDVLLAVGTSGLVSSASGLLRYARDVGALTVAVNPDHAAPDGEPLHGVTSSRYDVHVRAAAEVALPALLRLSPRAAAPPPR
jgi:NAD-dependent deacetylase